MRINELPQTSTSENKISQLIVFFNYLVLVKIYNKLKTNKLNLINFIHFEFANV